MLPDKPNFEKLQWKTVREEVLSVNPTLGKIIDEIDPPANYALFKCRYPYGTEALKKGKLYLPNERQEMVPLTDSSIKQDIRDSLSYNIGTNPVSLMLKNSVEVFMTMESHTIPYYYGLVLPGKIFGASRVLSRKFSHSAAYLWNITAGARSLFALPKISENLGHNRLKRNFKIAAEKPENLLNHWEVFRALANSKSAACDWSMEILYFSRQWFEKLDDPKWEKLHFYLLKNAWENTEFWCNQFLWNLIFSNIQQKKNLRPDPYIADTTKHILATAVGAVPAFAPALDDRAAPVSFIQKAYLEVYQLKHHYPTIMIPQFFDMYGKSNPVYYSLEYPCTIEFSPRSRRISNKTTDSNEINYVLDKYLNEIGKSELNLNGTPLFEVPQKVSFDFFHANTINYDGIRKSSDIPREDPSFVPKSAPPSNKGFPDSCSFVRGCIRISNK